MTNTEIQITTPPFFRRRKYGNGELRAHAPEISKLAAKILSEPGSLPPIRPSAGMKTTTTPQVTANGKTAVGAEQT